MVNGPECLVKMAQVAESAVAANLFDRHVGDGQLRDGIAHTEFIDQFGERLVEMDAHDSVHMVDIPIAQSPPRPGQNARGCCISEWH